MVRVNNTLQFKLSLEDSSNSEVTWSVNDIPGGSATFGFITPTGLYTAPGTLPPNKSVVITARSMDNVANWATATILLQSTATLNGNNYYVNAETADDIYDGTSPTYTRGSIVWPNQC